MTNVSASIKVVVSLVVVAALVATRFGSSTNVSDKRIVVKKRGSLFYQLRGLYSLGFGSLFVGNLNDIPPTPFLSEPNLSYLTYNLHLVFYRRRPRAAR
jgi:hypothetical protein